MLTKATHVIGLPIITIAQGKRVDKVEDIIYDPHQNRVKALLIDKGGWFAEAKIVLIHDATSIGEDAVMIEDQDKIKTASEVKDGVAAIAKEENYLTQTKVVAENGKELGKVSDIYFDTNTGEVEEFEVSQGLFKNVQSGKKKFKVSEIVTVGEDTTIVKSYTEAQFEDQAQHHGVQGAVNKTREKATSEETKHKVSGFMEDARDRLHDLGDRARNKVNEVKESPRTRETVDALKTKAEKAKSMAADKTEEGKRRLVEERKKGAVGQYLTVNILSPDDEVIARRGDLVTNDLIRKAESLHMLDKVLNNTSPEPKGGEVITNSPQGDY